MEYLGRKYYLTSPEGKHNTTLNILPSDVTFLVQCRACGVTREVSRDALGVRNNGGGELDEIEKRLRCGSCGAKDARLVYGYVCVSTSS